MNPKYVLNTEKYLAHQIWFVFHHNNGQEFRTAYSTALEPFVDNKNFKILSNRSHYMLDFNDFLEYATSDIAKKYRFDDFPDSHIFLYDTFPGVYESHSVISSGENEFSLVGASLSRKENELGILMQIRTFDQFYLHPSYENIINSEFANDLLSKDHNFPYIFVLMTLRQEKGDIVEVLRSELYPPIILGAEDYGIHWIGVGDHDSSKQIYNAFPEWGSQAKELLFDRDQFYFEAARLVPYIPGYFDFMYDLVLEERKKVGTRPSETKSNRKAKKKRRSIYKLVKSIRISYESEEKAREHLSVPKKNWTPPPFKYAVSGHWRRLGNEHWVGHDPEGNEVFGKTWINSYEKGADKESLVEEIVAKEPNITISLKQPLSYARDIIKSYGEEKSDSKEDHKMAEEKTGTENIADDRAKPSTIVKIVVVFSMPRSL